jgi:uncharacterized OsmC-like protein
MRLILDGEASVRLEAGGTGFEIGSEGPSISPYHLLAGSLASCTMLTAGSWAEQAGIDASRLTIHVSWENAEERPARIARVEMELRWPGLPEERVRVAERAADLCPIHATLERAVEVARTVVPLPREG